MPRARSIIPETVVIFAVTAVFLGPVRAAGKKDAGDAPPVLISTKGAAPKWKNLAELRQFAVKGNPQACFELGNRCLDGDGVAQDMPQAITFFELAAGGGVADAWFKLGKIYHDGLGGPPDYAKALDCYTFAARAGITEAQHNIGAMLVSARGVKRDYVEGLAWLIIATLSGDTSDAEGQVRNRLTTRPADIEAAESRAAELQKDLAAATVRAVFPGLSVPPAVNPPKAEILVPAPSPVEKPAITPPKIDLLVPVKLVVPPTSKS